MQYNIIFCQDIQFMMVNMSCILYEKVDILSCPHAHVHMKHNLGNEIPNPNLK